MHLPTSFPLVEDGAMWHHWRMTTAQPAASYERRRRGNSAMCQSVRGLEREEAMWQNVYWSDAEPSYSLSLANIEPQWQRIVLLLFLTLR